MSVLFCRNPYYFLNIFVLYVQIMIAYPSIRCGSRLFAAVPFPWQSFRVLVGETGADGLHDGAGCEVLGSNELQPTELTEFLVLDDFSHLWVQIG